MKKKNKFKYLQYYSLFKSKILLFHIFLLETKQTDYIAWKLKDDKTLYVLITESLASNIIYALIHFWHGILLTFMFFSITKIFKFDLVFIVSLRNILVCTIGYWFLMKTLTDLIKCVGNKGER